MGCATKCVAWSVFIFNIILACLGIAILTVGILLQLNVINYIIPVSDVNKSLDYLPITVIVIGGLIFITGLLGCLSAGRGSTKLLWTYIVVLIILFLVQICLGISIMFQVQCQDPIKKRIDTHLLDLIHDHQNENYNDTSQMDVLQRKFKCCGAKSPQDWAGYFTVTTPGADTDFVSGDLLPESCCPKTSDSTSTSTCTKSSPEHYSTGCSSLILENFNQVIQITYILIFAVAAQQFMGVLFAFILITSIRNETRRNNYRKY